MLAFLRTAFAPLNLAALLAIGGIGLSLRWLPGEMRSGAFTLLIAYTCCLLLATFPQRRRWAQNAALLLMPLLALAAIAVAPRMGTAQILLVVWAAVVVMAWPPLVVLAAIVAVDLAAFGVLRHAGHSNPVITTILYASFQGFAALTSHYARSAEEARDRLARTNADLLATRALLADAARDGERLRVARELHDVAGHKLTALRLNLRALQAAAPSPQLQLAEQLSAELLGDIRGVVHALRDTGGLDIDTALRALAAPYPRPALRLSIDEGVVVEDPALAETVLRTVQEALTNAARHGHAATLDVRLRRDGTWLWVEIEDDGRASLPLREGHGLTGMRERIDARGGRLRIARGSRGGVRIEAGVPA